MIKFLILFIIIIFCKVIVLSQNNPDQLILLSSDSSVITGKQSFEDIMPGSGIIRIKDLQGKYSDFTHSPQSTIIRTNNPIFELFIGDEPTDVGTMSIRRHYHDQNSLGSRLLIWDRDNSGNLELSAAELHNGIAEIKLNSNQQTTSLYISNEQMSGTVEFKIGSNVVGKFNQFGLQFKAYTTMERDSLTNIPVGTTIFNSTLGINQVWNGTVWN